MKIKVSKLIGDNGVEFATRYGSGVGIYKSSHGPKLGSEYGAEIDIDAQIDLDANARIISNGQYSIRNNESKNEIEGLVDAIDEDGMIYLRLGQDCLIMVENKGGGIKKGDWLLLTVDLAETRITLF